MTDRNHCQFPYTPLFGLIGFLAGVLVAVLRSRRVILQQSGTKPAAPLGPAADKDIPLEAILLPEAMPTGALPSPGELTLIEGIGSRVEAVLNKAGIHNLEKLAHTTAADLKAILVAAGNRISNPETWPKQAELAVDAKWDELKALQDKLKAGRRAAE